MQAGRLSSKMVQYAKAGYCTLDHHSKGTDRPTSSRSKQERKKVIHSEMLNSNAVSWMEVEPRLLIRRRWKSKKTCMEE